MYTWGKSAYYCEYISWYLRYFGYYFKQAINDEI